MTKHFGISRGTPVQSLGKKAMGDHFPNMTALSAYFFLDRAKNGEQYRLTSTGQVIRGWSAGKHRRPRQSYPAVG
jgi:hypothetical protein